MKPLPYFDGHNDLLTRILKAGGLPAANDFLTGLPGHLDVPKARSGGFAGGFFAVWIPTTGGSANYMGEMAKRQYDLALPKPVPQAEALAVANAEIAILNRLEALGGLRICTSVVDIEACRADGTIAAILHIEGAEAIDPEFHALDVFYRAGLRSLGPVWSRPTIYGDGVPFRFPGSPDIGEGLTEAGRKLIARCNELGIMIDLSHLNAAGFRDVAELSDAPLVATHSNAHALCPHARNLTDEQLERIAKSDGMVGVNFAGAMLRDDGRMSSDVPLDTVLAHFDHLLGILGEDRVGLGSDFDGAVIPAEIRDAAGVPVLAEAMSKHGYSDELIEKLWFGNWMRVLRATWK